MSENAVQERLRKARVARLATTDAQGRPHLIPVCFAYDGSAFYTALDQKPKQVPLEELARVQHIRAHPEVALLIDEYREDWEQLWYVLVRGRAEILVSGEGQKTGLRMLREKYQQYSSLQLLPENAPLIRITPARLIHWGTRETAPSPVESH